MNVVFKDKIRNEAVAIGDTEVCVTLLIKIYSLSRDKPVVYCAPIPFCLGEMLASLFLVLNN